MATQGPTTGATPAAMTSRLAQMQMRFQQRQQQERDQRKVEMVSSSKTTTIAATAVTHSGTGSSNSTTRSSTISAYSTATVTSSAANGNGDLSATLGAGKVRQMFDERRHRVAGIDKSYPLQPIQAKVVANSNNIGNSSSNGSAVSNGNGAKVGATGGAGPNNKTRVPPISANTKARLAMQQRLQQENGNGETLKAATFDDNENLLEDEKFPDSITFDDDLSLTPLTAPTPVPRKLTNVGKHTGPQNVNSLKLKPVPGRPPATSTLKATSAAKPVQKKTSSPVATSQSTTPSPTGGRGSQTSSAKSSTSRASTGKSAMATSASRKVSAASAASSMLSASPSVDGPIPDGLARCDICGRNFAEDRIGKHREICQKTKTKKRKVYDATKHRVQGTEAEKYVAKKKGTSISKKSITAATAPTGGADRRKSDWRRKHEEFIQAIRTAKEMQAHLAKGGKLSDLPPPPPSENPDYVQCPHCSRRFNQTAAERHIPKCATMLHNKPKPNQTKAKRF